MSAKFNLRYFLYNANPQIELVPNFRPIAHVQRIIAEEQKKGSGVVVPTAFLRNDKQVVRRNLNLFEQGSTYEETNSEILTTAIHTGIWMYGANAVHIALPEGMRRDIAREFGASGHGMGQFDTEFWSTIYKTPFEVRLVSRDDIPNTSERTFPLVCSDISDMIGFDIGRSDVKTGAIRNGREVYSDEAVWKPEDYTADEMERFFVDRIGKAISQGEINPNGLGVSAAGVIIDSEPRLASWTKHLTDQEKAYQILKNVGAKLGLDVVAVNDGTVSAVGGQNFLETILKSRPATLGLAFGSSIAVGSIDENGRVTDRPEEGAFVRIGYRYENDEPVDTDWSGVGGYAGGYLSQLGASYLIEKAQLKGHFRGVRWNPKPKEKLEELQTLLSQGDDPAVKIFETIGQIAGHAVAHYRSWTRPFTHAVVYGRVASKGAQQIVQDNANLVLNQFYGDLGLKVHVPLNDTAIRQGQALAAAALPYVGQ